MRFLRSHMGKRVVVAGRCLAAAGCFLALALVATPVTAQVIMSRDLMVPPVIPADSAAAYPQPFSVFFSQISNDPSVDIPATVLNDNNDDLIDASLADIAKDGGTVSVVDWVLVQLRVVLQDGQVPDNNCRVSATCRDQVTVVTKAALLLSDGSVTSADAGDLAEGILEFDDVEFNPDTHDMYIAIDHRNHLPVLSGKVDESQGEGEYAYDFTDPANAAEVLGEVLRNDVLAIAAGDADGNSALGLADLIAADEANRAGQTGYLQADVDMTSNMALSDVQLVDMNNRLGASRGVDF